MIVHTTRSGRILHADKRCPALNGAPTFRIHDEDALPHATRCDHKRCATAFLRSGQ
ncbi:MAG TPA: hypothetical protein VIL92_06080 [Gaiellaceae bacterium]